MAMRTGHEVLAAGVPAGPLVKEALEILAAACAAGEDQAEVLAGLAAVLALPAEQAAADPRWGSIARRSVPKPAPTVRDAPVPWTQWGTDIDAGAITQMEQACRLPIAVAGALMPDAHQGYGLPIGGVLATEGAVVPYAVGVDIACRMRLSVLDMPVEALTRHHDQFVAVLQRETLFGSGAMFRRPREHAVMDADWGITPVTRHVRERAAGQLGTSGSGNHFVEYGALELTAPLGDLPPGNYVAILSHSGSRGAGALVANHYTRVAQAKCADLPQAWKKLAWLELGTEDGDGYWAAMELMGAYAAANHACIHRHMLRALGTKALLSVENHHNFAWKEEHGGREVIVHRKGATPAGEGVLGLIPGSMATPGFLVAGRGSAAALQSASHGAGRRMSRTEAKNTLNGSAVRKQLKAQGITLIGAGVDEAPAAYKDIHSVMENQRDLVDILGRFDPKIVRMAEAGERPED